VNIEEDVYAIHKNLDIVRYRQTLSVTLRSSFLTSPYYESKDATSFPFPFPYSIPLPFPALPSPNCLFNSTSSSTVFQYGVGGGELKMNGS
jgi:hypothetical protein